VAALVVDVVAGAGDVVVAVVVVVAAWAEVRLPLLLPVRLGPVPVPWTMLSERSAKRKSGVLECAYEYIHTMTCALL